MAVDSLVSGCELDIGAFTTTVDLRVLPLGSYDIVLGMDWLATHQENIDCQRKSI